MELYFCSFRYIKLCTGLQYEWMVIKYVSHRSISGALMRLLVQLKQKLVPGALQICEANENNQYIDNNSVENILCKN